MSRAAGVRANEDDSPLLVGPGGRGDGAATPRGGVRSASRSGMEDHLALEWTRLTVRGGLLGGSHRKNQDTSPLLRTRPLR